MPATPATLSAEDMERFHCDGYFVVKGAFAYDDALAMQNEWWAELQETHGINRDDRSTWHPILGDLKRAKHSPIQEKILSSHVRGVIDDLLGRDTWQVPRDWGRTLATFPQEGVWDVPTALWHWDSPCAWHQDRVRALFVLAFIGTVESHGGGTLILSGSPRLLMQQDAALDSNERALLTAARRELFYQSHPWLMALTGRAPSPANRIALFMEEGTEVEGVPLRAVELTGKPGDMVFCHPAIVHCVSPNCGSMPRFMRIKMVSTHEGQELLKGASVSMVRGRARAAHRGRRRARQGDY